MKPTFCVIDNSIAFTGAFKCVLQQAILLKDRFDFIFIVPVNSQVLNHLQNNEIKVLQLPLLEISRSPKNLALYLPRLLQNTIKLLKIIKKEKVEIIQVNDVYNLLGSTIKACGYKGKLITYVRFLPSVMPSMLRKIWIEIAQRYSDRVIAVSNAVFKQLPPHPKNCMVYDAATFPERSASKSYIKDQSEPVGFLYLANYIPGKGQEYALKAFHKIIEQNPNVRLKFVGGDMGLQKNKLFKQSLEEYTINHGLQNAVSFFSFTKDVEALIKSTDVLLNFSEAESFSMTTVEACYYGTVVIATRCGGPEEIIEDGKTGILVENKNIQQMSEAMLNLSYDVHRREVLGRAAKDYVREKFSANNFFNACENIWQLND